MKKNTLSYLIILPIIGLIGFGVQDLILVSIFNFFLSKYSYFFLDNLLIEISLFIFVFACLVSLAMRHYGKRHLEFILVFTAVLFIWSYRFYSFYAMDTSKITPLLIFGSLFLLYIFKYWIDYSHNKTSTEVILEDNLGRKEFVKKLVDHLAKIKNQEAFNVALLGEWGSGKSYLLRYVKEELNGKENIIVVEFAPWSFENIQSIEVELLKAVKNNSSGALEEYFSELIHLLNADNENSIFKTISFGILKIFSKTKNEIQNSIKRELLNKKLFVLLDDLDRLETSEIESVMRIIRNTLNYPNVHFIVGFDDTHVLNSLGIEKNESKYLDKFFQLRFHVPVVKNIQGYFKEKFQKELSISSYGIDKDSYYKEFWIKVGQDFLKEIENLRSADNIVNNFKLIYEILKHDTDEFTLLQLEILRNIYPEEYLKLSKFEFNIDEFPFYIPKDLDIENKLVHSIKNAAIIGKYRITEKQYFYNYFRYVADDNQISLDELMFNLEECNIEIIYQRIKEGKGADLFKKIDFLLNNVEKSLNNAQLNIIVNSYVKYTQSTVSHFQPLVKYCYNKINSNEDAANFISKLAIDKVLYKIELEALNTQIDHDKIVSLFNEFADHITKFPEKSLKLVLIEIYNIVNRMLVFLAETQHQFYKQIDEILVDVFSKNPILFLDNMVIPLGQISENKQTYTIFNNFIPKRVNYNTAFVILENEINEKAEMYIEFLRKKQSLEFHNSSVEEYVEFSFI